MTEQRARLTPAEKLRAAKGACERLLDLPELADVARRSGCVAGFVATRAEIDPAPALDEARRRGARVALPRVEDARRPRLCFHLAESADLRPGRFGILEPPATSPEVAPGDIDLMIVPGLAFDAEGRRLGFGGGYYDELLAGEAPGRRARVVGLAYDFQIVERCPADERDERVDVVVTETRVIRRSDAAVEATTP